MSHGQHGKNTFWPDNSETELYIEANSYDIPFNSLVEQIKEHFGEDIDMNNICITSEYIHTDCIGYDLYDSRDYTRFIKIIKV